MYRQASALLSIIACTIAARSAGEPFKLIDPADPVRVAACSQETTSQGRRSCIYRDANRSKWNILFREDLGPPGTSNYYVHNALHILQGIVDQCKLGQTYLVRATDGVSVLHLSKDPNPDQIGCIRTFEDEGFLLRND